MKFFAGCRMTTLIFRQSHTEENSKSSITAPICSKKGSLTSFIRHAPVYLFFNFKKISAVMMASFKASCFPKVGMSKSLRIESNLKSTNSCGIKPIL
jgi:hypothetical protein